MHCRRGTASIEFALVGTLFFTMLIGIFDLGRLYLAQESLREATAAAARLAMVDATVSGCTQPAARVAAMTPFLQPAQLSLCVTRAVSGGQTTLTITASYPFVGLLSLIVLQNNQLTDTSTVVFTDP